MKKLISLLGATFLTASTGTTIISCATKPAEKDPFYQLPTTKPKTLEEAIEIIGYSYDLYLFYNNEYYYGKDAGKIEPIDSENWQKMELSIFATECMNYYVFEHLDYEGLIEFTTPNGQNYHEYSISKTKFDITYNLYKKDKSSSQHTKEWYTNWYNWALTTE